MAATHERFPEVDVRRASAEELPWDDDAFDLVAAQLVVHFMADPVAGLREMLRVTRPGGRVGACVWDHAGGRGPLSSFWDAARDLDPGLAGEDSSPGSREGDLARLLAAAGAHEVRAGELVVEVGFAGFEEWWEPYTFGVGTAGDYLATVDAHHRDALRERCLERLGAEPFTLAAVAWSVVGVA